MPYIEERSPGDFVFMYTDCTTLFCLPLSELIKVGCYKANKINNYLKIHLLLLQDPSVGKFKNNSKSKLNFNESVIYKYCVLRLHQNY